MNVISTQAGVGEAYQLQTQNAGSLNVVVEDATAAGLASWAQWSGVIDDTGQLTGTPAVLPVEGAGVVYTLDFNSSEWALVNLDSAPALQYSGSDRLMHVTVNAHFKSLTPDGNAHLPFVDFYQNDHLRYHQHTSVIVDVDPVEESSMSITFILSMTAGDNLTMQFGSDNVGAITDNFELKLRVVAIPAN